VAADAESFAAGAWTGEIGVRFRPADPAALAREVCRLVDPASAEKTLHWGRNYLYVARFAAADGPVEVAVKQFRRSSLRDRLRRRESKAARSWRAARALAAAGLATPEPVMLVESARAGGPSFYVCRYLEETLEARYLFRAANAGELSARFPGLDFPAYLDALGRTLRRLHDAGFWHRDMTGGNLLLPADQAGAPRDLYLLDLNRARLGRPPTVSERTRDLCRLALDRGEHQEALLAAYWGDGFPAWKGGLYDAYRRAFLAKNAGKLRLRRVFGRLRGRILPRGAHVHIPAPPAGAGARDRAVWDALSDQPHQHAGRLQKLGVRLADTGAHAEEAAAVAKALPRIWRRYRQLRRELHARPVPWGGAGVCVRPYPEDPEALAAALAELGVGPVLLRLHPWEADHGVEEELARALHAAGREVTFGLPQTRDLVKDPARWRAAVEELAERFLPYGRRFQLGHAINRSKWGIWNLREYVDLAVSASEILRRRGAVEILGPAVIDFEFHVTAAVLNLEREGLRFDVVSSLLYVDRRGAPEARQAGFDTVDKVVLQKAIAETARNAAAGGRCWLTEVNWPLWEGPHSPAGRAVAVDEETQADYLARYYLLALGTGLVERVFWWQLAAKGYGLIDPAAGGGLRRRPSFRALQTLVRELAGSVLEEVLPAPPPARLYLFRRPDGAEVVAGWSAVGGVRAALPRAAVAARDRDGEPFAPPAGREVELASGVRYFTLANL